MFKGRNTKPERTPQKGGATSVLIELQGCVAKMNSIVETACSGNAHVGINNSPYKVNYNSRTNGDFHDDYESPGLIDVQFVSFKSMQEQEMIELLRRISEIVVQGEQRAASIENSRSSDPLEHLDPTSMNNSIFEFFCEANVLDTIINIVTGVAFCNDGKYDLSCGLQSLGDNNVSDLGNNAQQDLPRENINPTKFLPPIAVATQAIQSVSILMQNVVKATSLYFILSNNRVNDLINLPLEYYSIAEQNQNEVGKGNYYSNRGSRKKLQSAEMSELTTLFVSFLKSLAMRMNPETLQFFLTYPIQSKSIIDFSSIQFPLYKRALEFCNPDEDTFVRVTAMNICLNTLRLATNGNPITTEEFLSIHQNQSSQSNNSHDESQRPDQKISPDGSSLHLTNALPFRERLAISHFVCLSSHVEALASATLTKVGQLCGALEEIIRTMDRIDWTLSKASDITKHERTTNEEDLQIQRIQLVKQFHDVAADFQDEIYLLEDVLAVGLVALNEQIIEMMFAGVVYPLVLQPLQIYRSGSSKANNSNTNQVADVSLAKSSFFVIASIYHYITHKPFLHLLTTALLHPLAPDASKSLLQTGFPTVVTVTNEGQVQIKIDEKSDDSLNCYSFGRPNDTEILHAEDFPGTKLFNECTYVLSPALVQLYQADSTACTLRQNSYRRSVLACLSGTDGMAMLQNLAIYSMDAILGTIKPYVLQNVLYGVHCRPESPILFNSNESEAKSISEKNIESDNFMVEIIASICQSVSTTFTSSGDLRNLAFNLVASHAVCCATLIDQSTKTTALKLIEHRRREAASLMCQIPTRLSKNSTQNLKENQLNTKNSIDEDLKMDRIFFDPFCDGEKFAVENFVRRQDGNFWDGPAFIAVAKDGTMNDLCKLICFDPNAGADCETEGLYRSAANSAVAYLQLDAFTNLLKESFDTPALQKQKGYLGVAAFALFNKNCMEGKQNTDRVLLSALPQPFSTFLFDEDVSSAVGSDIPQTGAVVQLVGKTAFPCVVEVTTGSSSLFSDSEASVIADGIKWQSLWMVLMGKFMILAEPVKKDSGGNGRVITSYPLCCLHAEKDESADILQSESPARRLLLTYFSPDSKPPGLFVMDVSDRDQRVNTDEVQITRSVMDLWFEDSNAAAKALKALNSKIVKARSRRGHKIREALAQDDRKRFQSLLNG